MVIATGDQNGQVRPPESADLPVALRQVDSSAYRNAAEVDGAVALLGTTDSTGGDDAANRVNLKVVNRPSMSPAHVHSRRPVAGPAAAAE